LKFLAQVGSRIASRYVDSDLALYRGFCRLLVRLLLGNNISNISYLDRRTTRVDSEVRTVVGFTFIIDDLKQS